MTKISDIKQGIEDYHAGKILIIVDDEDRENEGDFVVSAEAATPEIVNFMAKHGRGLVCVAMTGDRLDELGLHLMVPENTSKLGTSFTISADLWSLGATLYHTVTGKVPFSPYIGRDDKNVMYVLL